MENIFIQLHEINYLSITVRLALAVLFGGIIGLERGSHNHPAGFRTHILVCVGACLAMMTNQYIFENMNELSDPARLGAQVITGVGFLGVGTILVTGKHKIKGLTTAAGLWASACAGLALGIGFYSGAIIAGIFIFVTLSLLAKFEDSFYSRSRIVDLYIETETVGVIKTLLNHLRNTDIEVLETNFSQGSTLGGAVGIHVTVRLPKKKRKENKNSDHSEVIEMIGEYTGVTLVEEL